MIDEQNLLEYIKNSQLLDNEIRQTLITRFNALSPEQITKLVDYFNNHKQNIVQLLKKLNDTGICSPTEIQGAVNQIQKNELQTIYSNESKMRNMEIAQFDNLSTLWIK